MLRVVGRKEHRGAGRHIVTVKRIVKTIVQAILVILVTRVLIVTQVFVRQLMLNTSPYLQWIGHLEQGAAPRAVLGRAGHGQVTQGRLGHRVGLLAAREGLFEQFLEFVLSGRRQRHRFGGDCDLKFVN